MRSTIALAIIGWGMSVVAGPLGQWRCFEPIPGQPGLRAMAFGGRSLVCVVGDGGAVAVSRDAGEAWSESGSGTDVDLCTVTFADSLHGWAGGDSGIILQTTDGGQTWTRHSRPGCSRIVKICIIDADTVWACGVSSLARTTDGGDSWSAQWLPGSPDLYDMHCLNGMVAWVRGWADACLHTDDGGESWEEVAGGAGFGYAYRVSPEDTLNGWLTARRHRVIRTSDGGQTWDSVNVDTVDTLWYINDLEAFDPARVYVIPHPDWRVKVHYSTDSGKTWDVDSTLGTGIRGAYDLEIDHLGYLWLAGEYGVVATTRPAGIGTIGRPIVPPRSALPDPAWRLRLLDCQREEKGRAFSIAGRRVGPAGRSLNLSPVIIRE